MSKETINRAKDVALSLDDTAKRLDSIKSYVKMNVHDSELETKIAKLSTDTATVANDLRKKIDPKQG